VIHLDELVEVDTVEIKHAAEMVPEHKIVSEFDHSFYLLWVIITQQQ
jgi:hypothetical protein